MGEFVVDSEECGCQREELGYHEKDVGGDVVVLADGHRGKGKNHRDGEGGRRDGLFKYTLLRGHDSTFFMDKTKKGSEG